MLKSDGLIWLLQFVEHGLQAWIDGQVRARPRPAGSRRRRRPVGTFQAASSYRAVGSRPESRRREAENRRETENRREVENRRETAPGNGEPLGEPPGQAGAAGRTAWRRAARSRRPPAEAGPSPYR